MKIDATPVGDETSCTVRLARPVRLPEDDVVLAGTVAQSFVHSHRRVKAKIMFLREDNAEKERQERATFLEP